MSMGQKLGKKLEKSGTISLDPFKKDYLIRSFLLTPKEILFLFFCVPFLFFFASEAPDQAPRELTDGTDGRTGPNHYFSLCVLLFPTIFLIFLSCSYYFPYCS